MSIIINLTNVQETLVSGTNIKTINGTTLLGSGDLLISSSNLGNANLTADANRTYTLNGSLSSNTLVIKNGAGTDLLKIQGNGVIFSNGAGGVATNTAFGEFGLDAVTTGDNNTAFGNFALSALNTGRFNVGLGGGALIGVTSGFYNVGIGYQSLRGVSTTLYNTAIGYDSGRYITGGATSNTGGNNCVFIGSRTKALGINENNSIQIGDNVTGNGSNTTTIGNASTVLSVLRGTLNLPDCPTSSAGLNAGDIWSNSGVLTIV